MPGAMLAVGVAEPGCAGEVVIEALGDAVQVGQEAVVVAQFFERSCCVAPSRRTGLLSSDSNRSGVDAAKQCDGVRVPAPPQVVRQPM